MFFYGAVGFGPDPFGEGCLRNGQLEQSTQLKCGFPQAAGVIRQGPSRDKRGTDMLGDSS